MRKRDVEVGGEYAWQERYSFSDDEYRKVTLVEFLRDAGGRQVLVRDRDGEFETQLQRLIKPWSELGSKEKESEFRTRAEKYEHEQQLAQKRDPAGFEAEMTWRGLSPFEPGKGGVPRVPEWLPRVLSDMAAAVLTLDMGSSRITEDEQIACHDMLRELSNVCERIRTVAREMMTAWEAEDEARGTMRRMAQTVQHRLDSGNLPFASSEIMPVYAGYGMSRSHATAQYRTGSAVAADFMDRVADDYEELDRYASLATRWGWGFFLRWRRAHEVEMRQAVVGRRSRSTRRR